ncbi:MAG: hypothetical protein J6A75_10205 [Lachnospiraceae bacterium]|nr:hypothetical protein [Lachnospiraceae bacterium]
MTHYKLRSLFDDEAKLCEGCRRVLPRNFTENLCHVCKERELFSEVKEFIRANDVTEFELADYFNIPHQKVRQWIREGRIEYKELRTPKIESMLCQRCGEPIRFGNLCSKCQRQANTTGSAKIDRSNIEERIRHLQK